MINKLCLSCILKRCSYRCGNPITHVQNLLLLLPAIRQADNLLKLFWHRVHEEGLVKMGKLLSKMLQVPYQP